MGYRKRSLDVPIPTRPESLLDDPDHWRREARQMRAFAETASAANRETLLKIAAEYDVLVERAERRLAEKEP